MTRSSSKVPGTPPVATPTTARPADKAQAAGSTSSAEGRGFLESGVAVPWPRRRAPDEVAQGSRRPSARRMSRGTKVCYGEPMIRPIVVACFAVLASACVPAPSCSSTCSGCCTTSGECVTLPSAQQCGAAGLLCVTCAPTQQCTLGSCTAAGGSGGRGGGTGGGGGGTTGGGGGTTGGGGGSSTQSCSGTLIECGGRCVDSFADVTNCGGCGRSCAPGQVCDRGTCGALPDNCVQAGGCAPGYSCDPTTSKCVVGGCRVAAECPLGAQCTSNACACPFSQHLCGQICLANDSPDSCGSSCRKCPSTANGSSTCLSGVCGVQCASGFKLCAAQCVACQTPPNASPVCAGGSCDFACNLGFHRCGNACLADTSVDSCGASCTPCPRQNGTPSCAAGVCGLTCSPGFEPAGGACLAVVTWTSRPAGPPDREGPIVWDLGRSRAVLVSSVSWLGGTPPPLEIWEWNGTTWASVPAGGAPANRSAFAIGYDGQRVIFFGGMDTSFNSLADLWAWNGTTWQALQPATVPPARSGHAMAYDSIRHRLVLFGGFGATALLNDTWEWDGTTWANRPTAVAPPARSSHAMAFDAATGRVVLVGGYGANGELSDTWEWDGTTWTRPVASGPQARSEHGLAYDAARSRVVLFGGSLWPASQRYPTMFADTWEWDGTAWALRFPAQSPSVRLGPRLFFDPTRNKVQLSGGTAVTAAADGGYENAAYADGWELGP